MYFSFLLFLFFFWKYNKSRYVYIISSQSQDLVVFGSHCCLWTSIFFSEATEQSEPKHNRNHLIDEPLLCLWFCDNLKFNMAVKIKNACWLVKIFQRSSCHDQQPHILWYCCNMCIILGWYSIKFMLLVLIQINFCVRVILLWTFI